MVRRRLHKWSLVQVTWVDSARHGDGDGWIGCQTIDCSITEMVSVGWVYSAEKDCLVLIPHMDAERTTAYGALSIPWSATQNVTTMCIEK